MPSQRLSCDNCGHARADHKKVANKPGLGVCWALKCPCDRFTLPSPKEIDPVTEYGKGQVS